MLAVEESGWIVEKRPMSGHEAIHPLGQCREPPQVLVEPEEPPLAGSVGQCSEHGVGAGQYLPIGHNELHCRLKGRGRDLGKTLEDFLVGGVGDPLPR